jgi:hypothetical protein
MKDITAWQKDFRAAPSVFVVQDPEGFTTNVYESREAAEEEIAFYRRTMSNARGYHIVQEHVHSVALAERRWRRALAAEPARSTSEPAPQNPPPSPTGDAE